MTEQELNEVRNFKAQILDVEHHLSRLRDTAQCLTPILDGIPHAPPADSRIESIVAKILDTTHELERLRDEMSEAVVRLINRLRNFPLTMKEFDVVMLRYVACMNFRDIQFELHMSDATVFFHHRNATKKILKPTVDLQ